MIRLFYFVFIIMFAQSLAAQQTIDKDGLDTITAQQKNAESKAKLLSKQQKGVQKQITNLKSNLVRATAQNRGYEREVLEIQSRLSGLDAQKQVLKQEIFQDRQALTNMLAALQRIQRQPPPSILINSKNAVKATRAALLLSNLTQHLQIKSGLLTKRLENLQSLQKEIGKNHTKITAHLSEMETRLSGIQNTISNKKNLNAKLDKNRISYAQKAQQLAKKAKNLQDLIDRLEEQAQDIVPRIKPPKGVLDPSPHIKPNRKSAPTPVFIPKSAGRFADARGALPLPVIGKLSRKYGTKLKSGARAKGISLKTAPRAQVIAPFPSRVEFSGSFNDEHVVILNAGNGYFIVLTGLGVTFTSAGEHVNAGEPLGLMPRRAGEIFMEIRKNRASIDPMPWIARALNQ